VTTARCSCVPVTEVTCGPGNVPDPGSRIVTAGLAVGGLARSAGFRAHSRTEGTVTGWGFAGGWGLGRVLDLWPSDPYHQVCE
jgi:hypothetical protein